MRYSAAMAIFFSILLGLMGCEQGQRPFLLVQICVSDEEGIAEFINLMSEISKEHSLDFVDGSAHAQRMSSAMKVEESYEIIHIGAHGEDNYGFMAGNVGLSRYDIAVGFSEGDTPKAAHQFAFSTVELLRHHWEVHEVPAGMGALPQQNCPRARKGI